MGLQLLCKVSPLTHLSAVQNTKENTDRWVCWPQAGLGVLCTAGQRNLSITREHRKGDLLTLTSSAGPTPLPLACSFLKVLYQESSFALSPKVSCALWSCHRDWSPIPTLFLPLGVHWTLLGADATRSPTQCHGCLLGCWSPAAFGCWEGMVWAKSSLRGATSPYMSWGSQPSMAKLGKNQILRVYLFTPGQFSLFEQLCFGYPTAGAEMYIITETFL